MSRTIELKFVAKMRGCQTLQRNFFDIFSSYHFLLHFILSAFYHQQVSDEVAQSEGSVPTHWSKRAEGWKGEGKGKTVASGVLKT